MQKKTLQNPNKHTNSIKLDPLSCALIPALFIKRYTRSIFCDVLLKIEKFLNLFVNKLFWGSLKMSTKYCVTKSKKKTPHFSKIHTRELSFHTIQLYENIHLVYKFWDNNWKLSTSWTYLKINLASSHNPKKPLPKYFKTVCN